MAAGRPAAARTNQERRQGMDRSGPPKAHRISRRQTLRRGAALGLVASATASGPWTTWAAPARQTGLKGGGGTLIAAIGGDPATFNLNLRPDPNATIAARNVFRSLVTFGQDYTIQPDLALAWSISDDGLTYTFELDPDAAWHDGESVAASDVRSTLDLLLDDEAAPAHEHLAVIAGIETPNDRTVVLTLHEPAASLLAALANDWAFILPAHLYLGGDWRDNPANLKPVGSGPFRLLSATPGGSVDLGAFHDYSGRGPFLDHLLLQVIPDPERALAALRNGEIDVITYPLPPSLLDDMRQAPGFTVSDVTQPRTWYLGFNLTRNPISDPAVRQRLAGAIDREQLVDVALGGSGIATTTFVPALLVPAEPNDRSGPAAGAARPVPIAGATGIDPAQDTANAQAAPANPTEPATLPASTGPLALSLLYDTGDAAAAALATALQGQLQASTIALDLIGLDQSEWQSRLASGGFDLALIIGPRWPDPASLRDLAGSSGRDNFWSFASPMVDELFAAANAATNTTARAAAFAELEQVLAADPPLLPLLTPTTSYVATDRASGLPYDPVFAAPGRLRFNLARLRRPAG